MHSSFGANPRCGRLRAPAALRRLRARPRELLAQDAEEAARRPVDAQRLRRRAAPRSRRRCASSWPHCPSIVSVTGPPEALRISRRASGRNTSGRWVSVCGQIGVSTIACTSGVRIGPARGQRVRGRAGRRRDDQAVGLVGRDLGAVEARLEIEQARDRPLGQHRVVDRAARRRRLADLPRRGRIVTASRMRSSIGQPPGDDVLDRAPPPPPRAYGVMNPRLPRLTPKIGTPWSATSDAPYRKVPSPPSTASTSIDAPSSAAVDDGRAGNRRPRPRAAPSPSQPRSASTRRDAGGQLARFGLAALEQESQPHQPASWRKTSTAGRNSSVRTRR